MKKIKKKRPTILTIAEHAEMLRSVYSKAMRESNNRLPPLPTYTSTDSVVHRLSQRMYDNGGYFVAAGLCGIHGLPNYSTGLVLLEGPYGVLHHITDDPRCVTCDECLKIQAYVVGKWKRDVTAFLDENSPPSNQEPKAPSVGAEKPKASPEDSKDDV